MESRTIFDDLSDDLYAHILSFLDLKNLKNMSEVSKKYNGLAQENCLFAPRLKEEFNCSAPKDISAYQYYKNIQIDKNFLIKYCAYEYLISRQKALHNSEEDREKIANKSQEILQSKNSIGGYLDAVCKHYQIDETVKKNTIELFTIALQKLLQMSPPLNQKTINLFGLLANSIEEADYLLDINLSQEVLDLFKKEFKSSDIIAYLQETHKPVCMLAFAFMLVFTQIVMCDKNGLYHLVNQKHPSIHKLFTSLQFGYSLLHMALSRGSVEIARDLVLKGANVNLQFKSDKSPLFCAVDSIEEISLLEEKVEKKEYDKFYKSMKGVIRLLLEKGADPHLDPNLIAWCVKHERVGGILQDVSELISQHKISYKKVRGLC